MQKRFIFYILFVAAFLLTGIIGHDPWKQDETYSFGIIYHFYTTHTWLVPMNAGEPFMEKPPLYYWTATTLCDLLSPLLPLHDAARTASFLYMLVAIYFMWESSRVFFRKSPRGMDLISLALFMGTLGVVRHAHDMFTDVALLAGSSITLYGLALLTCGNENWKKSGFWLGLGIGITFLSKGLFMPAVFGVSFIILLATLPSLCRLNTLTTLLVAFIVAAPFLCIWPALLYNYSPELFKEWFWDNNVGRFLGFSVAKLGAGNKPGYILYSVLWFAFPVFPLAMVALWKKKAGWKAPEYLLPALISVMGLVLLALSATARALYILPLIPAFTILAAQGLVFIPEFSLKYWNTAVRLLSLAIVIALWLVWWGLGEDHPLPFILPYVGKVLPVDFIPPHTQIREIANALLAGLLYIALVFPELVALMQRGWNIFFTYILPVKWATRYVSSLLYLTELGYSERLYAAYFQDEIQPPAGESSQIYKDTARIWFAGIAVIWTTVNTLLLPWINETKSYRTPITEMDDFISHSSYSQDCINELHLGESITPMLEYFSKNHTLNTIKKLPDARCPLLLTTSSKEAPDNANPAWRLIWKKSRDLDAKDEELRLYVRNSK